MATVRLYGEFGKVDEQSDGTVIVSGIASSEAQDNVGEIVKADAMRRALPEYLKFPAVREMHQLVAAGRTIAAEVADDGKTYIEAHVVDPVAVKKVRSRVYNGFSIGGRVPPGGRNKTNPAIIEDLVLTEISLVDRPMNPEATFLMFKADWEESEHPRDDHGRFSSGGGVGPGTDEDGFPAGSNPSGEERRARREAVARERINEHAKAPGLAPGPVKRPPPKDDFEAFEQEHSREMGRLSWDREHAAHAASLDGSPKKQQAWREAQAAHDQAARDFGEHPLGPSSRSAQSVRLPREASLAQDFHANRAKDARFPEAVRAAHLRASELHAMAANRKDHDNGPANILNAREASARAAKLEMEARHQMAADWERKGIKVPHGFTGPKRRAKADEPEITKGAPMDPKDQEQNEVGAQATTGDENQGGPPGTESQNGDGQTPPGDANDQGVQAATAEANGGSGEAPEKEGEEIEKSSTCQKCGEPCAKCGGKMAAMTADLRKAEGEASSYKAQVEALEARIAKVQSERESGSDDLAKARAERDAARAEVEKLTASARSTGERLAKATTGWEGAEGQIQKIRESRDSLQREVDSLKVERDAASDGLAKVRAARDANQKAMDALRDERDSTASALQKSRATVDALQREIDALRQGRDDASTSLAKTAAERESFSDRLVEATAERDEAQREAAKYRSERDQIEGDLAKMKAEVAGLEQRIQRAEAERDSLEDRVRKSGSRASASEGEATRAMAEKEALAGRIQKMQADHAALEKTVATLRFRVEDAEASLQKAKARGAEHEATITKLTHERDSVKAAAAKVQATLSTTERALAMEKIARDNVETKNAKLTAAVAAREASLTKTQQSLAAVEKELALRPKGVTKAVPIEKGADDGRGPRSEPVEESALDLVKKAQKSPISMSTRR